MCLPCGGVAIFLTSCRSGVKYHWTELAWLKCHVGIQICLIYTSVSWMLFQACGYTGGVSGEERPAGSQALPGWVSWQHHSGPVCGCVETHCEVPEETQGTGNTAVVNWLLRVRSSFCIAWIQTLSSMWVVKHYSCSTVYT